ncbi:hypothetical protein A2U01_0035354, partial [Trifolium medium]|nr:hypothetical protein [Trifolium medium]
GPGLNSGTPTISPAHHLVGVGLLVFPMGFKWFWVLEALFR